jgi:hypothetical protein
MYLHVVSRVCPAGGPDEINNWSQDLIRERRGREDRPAFAEEPRAPSGILDYLSSNVSVGGTLWSDLVRVRIELGGGFYHYGVVVYPNGVAPPPEWWQSILGWPPEVVIYLEE